MREPHNHPVTPRTFGRLLWRYPYFQDVDDLDQIRQLVAGQFCSHDMDQVDGTPFNAWMNAVPCRGLLYSAMGYGAGSLVKPGRTETFLPVMIPLSGGGTVQVGRQSVVVSTSMAAVVSATEPLSMQLTPDCTFLIVCIDRDALERLASELIGEPVSAPLRFALGMDLTQDPAARWYRQLLDDVEDLDSPDSLILSYDLSAHNAEQRVMSSLLLTQPNNYSDRMRAGRVLRTPSRIVRMVQELVEEHPELPHTCTSLAEHAHCSVRALGAAFKKHTGLSTMTYVRERRLRRARELLNIADPAATTVSRIAGECGFTQVARFAGEYQHRFGEQPSTTLRRC